MKLRLFGLPAAVLGAALAILFFKIYGVVSRPAVPKPIAIIVSQFAPGVEIGATVSDVRHRVAAMSYVPHLGFVGVPGARTTNLPDGGKIDFSQVRLLLDEETRLQPQPDPAKSRVEAVEIVTGQPGASGEIVELFTRLFRNAPRRGCLRTTDATRFRDVSVWTTPNERGGVALVADYHAGKPASYASRFTMTSVLAFTGKFDGGRTLRGDFTEESCLQLAQPT